MKKVAVLVAWFSMVIAFIAIFNVSSVEARSLKKGEKFISSDEKKIIETNIAEQANNSKAGLAAREQAQPSVSDAKKIIETNIAKQSEGVVKLVSFEKTDGIKQNFNGMEFYTMEYSATFEIQQESWEQCDSFGGCFRNFPFRKIAPAGMEAAVLSFKHYNAGSKIKTSGKMSFQKTENGWRVQK